VQRKMNRHHFQRYMSLLKVVRTVNPDIECIWPKDMHSIPYDINIYGRSVKPDGNSLGV
jgi:hypothetical protein